MFSKLKEKLKSWTKKISKGKEIIETPEEITEKPKKEIKEIQPPTKFNMVTHKVEPDLEKRKDTAEKLVEEEKRKEKSTPSPELITSKKSEPTGEQFEPEKKSFFQKITSKVTKTKISEKEFEIYAEELEMLLLENNVALEVTEKIIKELKQEITGKEFLRKEIEGQINETIKEILRNILIEPFNLIEKIKEKSQDQSKEPYVVLFCGINGTGKTTTIAKIAQQLKDNNLTCILAAADTFRAAAIDQIKKHGEKLNVKVIANEYGSDPASVGFDAIKYAKKNFINCVLIDTAGRMHSSKNLLQELEKIARVTKPDTKIFVGESITGNDAIEQIKSFNFSIGIDGIILTKADIDEKGGTSLSVGYVTKKPILYLGTGQEYDKIEIFDKNKFIEKLGLDD